MRVRFAPSPTGHLHVGNARTALFNWLWARGRRGVFVLRIEDTDAERSTPESEAAILEDLRWLGIEWDEGPDVGGPDAPYRQSERLELHQHHAARLLASGHAYHCFCAPAQLEADRRVALASGRSPRYAGTCRAVSREEAQRRLGAGQPAAIRLRVPSGESVRFTDLVRGEVAFDTHQIGDPVLLRADGRPAYNFAVVVDDALMRVSDVVRGEDHISNTPRQILIYRALGYEPPRFAHLPLVMGPDHAPLSKRHGATSVAEFRAAGYLPEALVNYLALIGWSPGGEDELLPVQELARRFRIEDVGLSAGVFDEQKLAWVNRHYLRSADPDRVLQLALPAFAERQLVRAPNAEGLAFLRDLLPMAMESVDRTVEIPRRLAFIFAFDAVRALTLPEVREVVESPGGREVVAALAEELSGRPRLDRETFRAAAGQVRQRTGQKGRALFHPVRVALTGEVAGPELDLAVPAIDRGAELPSGTGVAPVLGCRERAAGFLRALEAAQRTGPAA